MKTVLAKNVDEYIDGFPEEIQKKLKDMRATIKKAAPNAEEAIKYAMPTLVLHGNLVHFAAFKNHIGFYPAPSGIDAFKKELSAYESSKGAIRFPMDAPLPHTLITKIVKFRIKENLQKAKDKKK
ncbi:iron chaperone [Chryseosolibacter indicus]